MTGVTTVWSPVPTTTASVRRDEHGVAGVVAGDDDADPGVDAVGGEASPSGSTLLSNNTVAAKTCHSVFTFLT